MVAKAPRCGLPLSSPSHVCIITKGHAAAVASGWPIMLLILSKCCLIITLSVERNLLVNHSHGWDHPCRVYYTPAQAGACVSVRN